jgi:hypothetical protein
MAKKTTQKRAPVKTDARRSQMADRQTKARKAVRSGVGEQGDQSGKGTRQASLTKGKADPGALKDFSDVETPQKPGRRLKTAAKSGYANLIPKSVKK